MISSWLSNAWTRWRQKRDTPDLWWCASLHYEPIAGHNPSNSLVQYLSEGREIEVALAPIRGTRLLAPFRLSVMSILGNVLIEANQFEATAVPLDAATVADPKSQ
jgi:hypothetical protein